MHNILRVVPVCRVNVVNRERWDQWDPEEDQ